MALNLVLPTANHQPAIANPLTFSLERLLQTAALATASPKVQLQVTPTSLPLTFGLPLLRPKPAPCSPQPISPVGHPTDHLTSILTAAVRLAVSSFVGKPGVSIQGKLVVQLGSADRLTLSFDDDLHPASPVVSKPSAEFVPTSAHETTTTTTTTQTSRRKSYHPTKMVCQEPVQTSPISDSGCGSPSVDSCALDLSRAGSLSDSAPMTPCKESCCSPPHFDSGLLETQRWLAQTASNSLLLLPARPQQQQQVGQRIKSPRIRTSSGVSRRSSLSRRFPCNQCRDEFFSLNALEQHTLAAHGTYKCHICKADFTQRSNLQRHALKHIGFKPFECRVCVKAYYRKDHLMRHMEMVHPGFAPRENITVHLTSSESLEYLDRNGIAVESLPSCRSEDRRVEEEKRTGEVEEEQVPVERIEAEDVTMELDEHENNSTEVDSTP